MDNKKALALLQRTHGDEIPENYSLALVRPYSSPEVVYVVQIDPRGEPVREGSCYVILEDGQIYSVPADETPAENCRRLLASV